MQWYFRNSIDLLFLIPNLTFNAQAQDGILEQYFPDTMTIQFKSLGVNCTKKDDVEAVLEKRQTLGVDPYGHGFKHAKEKKKYRDANITSIRLCFQVRRFPAKYGATIIYSSFLQFLKNRPFLSFCLFQVFSNKNYNLYNK